MPSPKHRSRSLRRIFVKTASKINIHYRKRKPAKPKCPECGVALKGIARARATKFITISKTEKMPSRKFANLCFSCSRRKLIETARNMKW